MNCSQGRPESLAAFLARIRPGDRCACCGAILQSIHRGSRTDRVATGPSNLNPAAAVACPECGCEISDDNGLEAEENLGALNPAA